MKRVYIAVFVIFVCAVLLFVGSLVYLNREKHKVYYFNINLEDHDIGNIRVDKYVTDEALIYKSVEHSPYLPILTESRSKLILDRDYCLSSYLSESSGGGAEETVFIENSNDNISYVATSRSEFACLSDLPIRKGTFIFDESSPATYLPILNNYDFKLGRSQAFNIVTSFSAFLPPMKRVLTLTSIRDEYIKVDSKKIKAVCLVIKIKNSPQGILWVTKYGGSIIKVEFPDKKLTITRTFYLKKVPEPKKPAFAKDGYAEEDIKFSNKNIQLSGTITIPPGREGRLPAVLLIGDDSGSDRNDGGLFTYIADILGKNGCIVFRYDNRGIGASGGDFRATTDADSYEDAKAALDYLLSRKDVDPQRIAIIGHGKGAFFAVKLSAENKEAGSLILMAPIISSGGETDLNFDSLNEMASKLKWDDQYLKLAMKSRMETLDKVKKTKSKWVSLMRTRCFLKKLRDHLEENPTDIIRKVEVPVLILHGKDDEFIPAKSSATLDKALEDSGNKNHKLIYYGYLGHFFGKLVNDGSHRLYYEIDKEVLDTVNKWLDSNLIRK